MFSLNTSLSTRRSWWDRAHSDYSGPIGSKRREKLRKLELKPSFPSQTVMEAYMAPLVDESRDKFR